LSLLSDPLDVQILRAFEDGPLGLTDLRRAVGSPPETTLRKHLRAFTDLGVLARAQQRDFPAPVSYELGSSGLGLLEVAASVAIWLRTSPDGPISLGTPPAKSAIKALVDGWTTKMLRALAAKPFSLTELDRLISGVNYPALERRLSAMRLVGLVASDPTRRGSTPYRVTPWLREGMGVLVAAADWESRRQLEGCEPLAPIDAESIFLLAVPLVVLPSSSEGSGRLVVDFCGGGQRTLAGVVASIEGGCLVSCVCDLRSRIDSSAVGSPIAWLDALTGRDDSGVELGGDRGLADTLVTGLRRALVGRADRVPVA
jgi:DNA-binding HxlR family transcriptional regulator